MGWKYRRRRLNKGRATGEKQRRRTIVVLLVARAGRGENYGKKRSRRVSRHGVLPPTTMIIRNVLGMLPLAIYMSVFGNQVVRFKVGGGHNFPLRIWRFVLSNFVRGRRFVARRTHDRPSCCPRGPPCRPPPTAHSTKRVAKNKRQPCAPRRPSP